VILYHFTSASYHLPKILAAGYLKVVESNLSRTREHAGPDVVWLTSSPDPAASRWWVVPGARSVDKAQIRITVDVPKRDVTKWRTWAARRGIDPRWARTLAEAGGSGSWYVIERPVPAAEWTEIINARTGGPVALQVQQAEAR
jgi:hypothetical protein